MPDSTNRTTISEIPTDQQIGGRKDWGNKLVVNTGLNPVVNFNFMLRVEGVFDLPCKSVKGIHRENEFDYIQEGGLNDYVHLKRKPISKPFTFQVERYVGVNWVDPLPLGTELTLPVILFVNTHVFPGLQPVRNYVCTGCTVISKDYGELNAEVSGLLVETVTIAYREMVCLDIPNDAYGEDTWEFDGKNREGKDKKKRKYNANLYNTEWETSDAYSSVKKMEERAAATKWNIKSDKKPKNAKFSKEELTTVQMKEKATKGRWTPEKDEQGHLKTKHGKDYEQYVSDYNKEIQNEIESAQTEEEKKAAEDKKIAMNGSQPRKYEHSETARKNSSAKVTEGELTAAQMEAKAEQDKWTPKKNEQGQLEVKHGRDYEQYATDYNKEIQKEIESAQTEEEKKAAEGKKIALSGNQPRKYEHSKAARQNSSAKVKEELTAEEMEEKAKKYEHSDAARQNSSAKVKEELTAAQMEAKAEQEKWTPKKDASGHLETKHGRDYEQYATDHNKEIQKEIDAAQTPEEKQEAEGKKTAMGAAANRLWPAQASANTEEMITPEARQYQHSSTPGQYEAARHNQKEIKRADMESKASVWPPQNSAHTEKMKTPEPRLWPKVKSARQITEFLKKH